MHMIGTPAASTKGYSTNVTPPAVNGPGNGSRNRKGSRSRLEVQEEEDQLLHRWEWIGMWSGGSVAALSCSLRFFCK